MRRWVVPSPPRVLLTALPFTHRGLRALVRGDPPWSRQRKAPCLTTTGPMLASASRPAAMFAEPWIPAGLTIADGLSSEQATRTAVDGLVVRFIFGLPLFPSWSRRGARAETGKGAIGPLAPNRYPAVPPDLATYLGRFTKQEQNRSGPPAGSAAHAELRPGKGEHITDVESRRGTAGHRGDLGERLGRSPQVPHGAARRQRPVGHLASANRLPRRNPPRREERRSGTTTPDSPVFIKSLGGRPLRPTGAGVRIPSARADVPRFGSGRVFCCPVPASCCFSGRTSVSRHLPQPGLSAKHPLAPCTTPSGALTQGSERANIGTEEYPHTGG